MRSRYCLVQNLEDLFLKPIAVTALRVLEIHFHWPLPGEIYMYIWIYSFCGQNSQTFFRYHVVSCFFLPNLRNLELHLSLGGLPWEIGWFNPKRWLKHRESLGVVDRVFQMWMKKAVKLENMLEVDGLKWFLSDSSTAGFPMFGSLCFKQNPRTKPMRICSQWLLQLSWLTRWRFCVWLANGLANPNGLPPHRQRRWAPLAKKVKIPFECQCFVLYFVMLLVDKTHSHTFCFFVPF